MSQVIQHLHRAGMTDGQLLSRYIEGRDEDAFTVLVKRHGPMVWGVCRRLLTNHQDAEDAFQATFLVLVRKAATILPREMVANWLYGVAYMTAQRVKVAAAKAGRREKQVVELPEPTVAEPELWEDVRPLLDLELTRLPNDYRVVLVLCDLEGKTRKEAARQLHLPEGTVASRVARARAMLAKRLIRHGLAVSGATLAVVLSEKAMASVPASVVSSTIKAASLLAGGTTATAAIPVQVAALTEEVMKTMLLTKLRNAMAVLVAMTVMAGLGVGLLGYGMGAGQQTEGDKAEAVAPQKPKANTKEAEEGTLLVDLEGVDPEEGTITVSRLGRLIRGSGDERRGAGQFSRTVRLENVPVAQTARIVVNGKLGKLTDLKPGMFLSLQLAVKGSVTVQEITANTDLKARLKQLLEEQPPLPPLPPEPEAVAPPPRLPPPPLEFPCNATVEGGRAIFTGKTDELHDLVVSIEREGKPFEWRGIPIRWTHSGIGDEFEVVVEASKVPVGDGKSGDGFVLTFKKGAAKSVTNVLTEANPILVGTFALRRKADFISNGDALTFADITLNDGKRLQVTFRLERTTK